MMMRIDEMDEIMVGAIAARVLHQVVWGLNDEMFRELMAMVG